MLRKRLLVGLGLGALALSPSASPTMAAAPQKGVLAALGVSPLASSVDLPPGCGNHWKAPNLRVRTASRDTYLHTMSNACVPYGPLNGTVKKGSTFNVYFADPYEPLWCYGYSVNLGKKGYILCSAL